MTALNRCNKDSVEIADAMIAAGTEVNLSRPFLTSHLMYAVGKQDVVMIKALLRRGADPNLKNDLGETPLMVATTSSGPSAEVVKILLAAGADPRARDNQGRTALSRLDQYAIAKTDRAKVGRIIKSAGGTY
jgi:ankyrin repeat protein